MTGDHGSSEAPPLPVRVSGLWWRVLRIAYLRFGFSVSVLMAAAIAFFSLICLGPLGILLAAGLQLLLGPGGDVYLRIEQAVNALGTDAAAAIMPQVVDLLHNPDAHIAGAISVIALVWAGMRLFEIVERSLTAIWPGKVLRSYFGRKLISLAMMVVAGVLLGSFVLFSALLAAAHAWLQQFPGIDADALRHAQPRFLLAYWFAMSYLAFALLYKFMPVQSVATRAALAGAACAAVVWHLGSLVFTYGLSLSHQQGAIYGGLAGIVLFSLWAFLGAEALLFGAQFSVAYEHVFLKARGPEEDDELISWPQRLTEQV